MKRTIPTLCMLLILACAAQAFSQAQENEDSAFYYQLFKYSKDFGEKAAFLSAMAQTNDETAVTSFDDALDSLMATDRSTLSATDAEDYDWAMRVACVSLGKYSYSPAADKLYRVFVSNGDPLVRSEAVMALGSMKASEYVDKIAAFLDTLNLSPTTDTDAGEKLAYGCVVSLGNMRDPRGWRSVFFASQGWYSKRVRDQALDSMKLISSDPSGEVLSIIRGSYDAKLKAGALKFVLDNVSDRQARLKAAREAYRQGAAGSGSTVMQRQSFLDLRIASLNALISLGDTDPEILPTVESMWDQSNTDERILISTLLSVNASESAVALLRRLIVNANLDRKSGVADDATDRLGKALVQAAGRTKNPMLSDALQSVIDNAMWPSGVIMAAKDALAAVKAK